MKRHRSLFVIVVIGLIITCFGYSLLCGGLQDGVEADYHGKVIGQIVDPTTGKAVNEPFFIYIYDSKSDSFPENLYRWGDETDERGKFELELSPYIYYLQFCPVSSKSKYCRTPYPYYLEEKERDVIRVEPGKITYFKKKASIGGILKLYIADMNDIRFNPQEKFMQKFNITSYIVSDFYNASQEDDDDLNDGEQTVNRLYEGKYRIHIEFEGLGYKDFKKDNILVEKGKTTEVNIKLDLTDTTGIEGIVTDAAGVPLEGVDALFSVIGRAPDDTIVYKAITNKDGYYRLTGMPEGKYYLVYFYNTQNQSSVSNSYGYLEIKKNVLLKLA